MVHHPLVSVVIPTYNRANYLAAAIESVFAQTYVPTEVIVVDDGSTDHSAELVRTYPDVHYFYQANQGVSVARNVGITAAQGELVAFLDSDDCWQPNKLSRQVAYMLEHPDVSITATHVLNVLEPGAKPPDWFEIDWHLGEMETITPSTLMVRKPVFDQIGNFSPDYRAGEDTEWLCRARDAQIPMVMIPEPLTLKRFHDANLTWETRAQYQLTLLRILKASITRKKNTEKA